MANSPTNTPANIPWLTIVGIGEDGFDGVAPAGKQLIENAKIILGGARHLEMLPGHIHADQWQWKSPLRDTLTDLESYVGTSICVLATGDPMSYGIGVTLGRKFGTDALTVIPAIGAFSYSAAEMGWALQDADCLTLHGRPLSILNLHLYPNAKLLILSANGSTPTEVATLLCQNGFGESRITALAHLGGSKQQSLTNLAKDWQDLKMADLNTLAIELVAGPDAKWHSRHASLPDEAYLHDGQLTKREMRALTLSNLQPYPGALLWDVGSGCGSIAIEWMRAGGQAIAIESNPVRADMIAKNAATLGVSGLKIIEGKAPDTLTDLIAPDAIFIGGGITNDGVSDACWKALKPQGVFAANAVTLEGEAMLIGLQAKWGGEMSRLQTSRLKPVGRLQGWKPFMPVTLYHIKKDTSGE